MKYIIMAGTSFQLGNWEKPKHTYEVNGEVLIARTIRLLQQAGVTDIAITSNHPVFSEFGIPWIEYDSSGYWMNAFYKMEKPVCYIFGDVYFSPEAIQTIVGTETQDIEFFASAPPFDLFYTRQWAEPFAFKVVNTEHFFDAIEQVRQYDSEGKFRRHPIAWELWQVIKGTELNKIDYTNYTVINDYTTDLDHEGDIRVLEAKLAQLERGKTVKYMIHACPRRLWYVNEYLIPSMQEQGCENITVHVDEKMKGSLSAHLDSYLELPDDDEGTWHLQDDVIICHDFAERTAKYNFGIVCGFSSKMYDGAMPAGFSNSNMKWFSFPCIRIPNKTARGCAQWLNRYIIGNRVYEKFWKDNKNEDWGFWLYIKDQCKGTKVYKTAPNLVDHVDYLIGGSKSEKGRKEQCRSQYWEDEYLVRELERRLQNEHR